jgi:hypothetical protein
MPEPVRYRNEGIQFGTGMLPYRTEIQDAGMPMPRYAQCMTAAIRPLALQMRRRQGRIDTRPVPF